MKNQKPKTNLITLSLLSLLLLTACTTPKEIEKPEFTFNESNIYTGFDLFSHEQSKNDLMKKGYYILEGLTAEYNRDIWNAFLASSSNGSNDSIRIVKYNESVAKQYIIDLFYIDGQYYAFDSNSDKLEKNPYKYLLILDGEFGNPPEPSGLILLGNDKKISFDQYVNALFLSDSETMEAIKAYQFIHLW